jgi:hypothetical protein
MKMIEWVKGQKPAIKYTIIIAPIVVIIILIIVIIAVATYPSGKGLGAYLKVPDSSNLQYRLGNDAGLYSNGWDDSLSATLGSMAGYDGWRKKLPQNHLETWGYGIEIHDCQTNQKVGILDVVGFLATPTHSTNPNDAEHYKPLNLYEDIWDGDEVNKNNYWAYYVYQTVNTYKSYIKIWETWNEPDYTTNHNVIGSWEKNPPNPDDLKSWHGTIFEYIRLLRITYEVAKKVDPDCFVATGGLGYTSFLDGIMRYTDNPEDGSVTRKYPAYGGAYFDCDAYHQYPKYGTSDLETGEKYNGYGSDSLAKKVVILKKSHHYIIKKYGFGSKYPDKIFVNTETGVTSKKKDGVGGDLERRNWIIKLALYAIEYDVKQVHLLNLVDNDGFGDFTDVGKFTSLEDAFKKLKDSSKGRLLLKKINVGKYVFDEAKTKKLRESLQNNITGIVLKRKFPKVENETHYAGFIYSFWRYCENEETSGEIDLKLNLPFDPLFSDWLQKEKNISRGDTIKVSSTPVFLLGSFDDGEKEPSGTSTLVIVLSIIGIILLLMIAAFIGLYCFRRFVQKKDVPMNKNILKSLL